MAFKHRTLNHASKAVRPAVCSSTWQHMQAAPQARGQGKTHACRPVSACQDLRCSLLLSDDQQVSKLVAERTTLSQLSGQPATEEVGRKVLLLPFKSVLAAALPQERRLVGLIQLPCCGSTQASLLGTDHAADVWTPEQASL